MDASCSLCPVDRGRWTQSGPGCPETRLVTGWCLSDVVAAMRNVCPHCKSRGKVWPPQSVHVKDDYVEDDGSHAHALMAPLPASALFIFPRHGYGQELMGFFLWSWRQRTCKGHLCPRETWSVQRLRSVGAGVGGPHWLTWSCNHGEPAQQESGSERSSLYGAPLWAV